MTEIQPRFSLPRQAKVKTAILLSLGLLVMVIVFGCVQVEKRSQLRFQSQIEEANRKLPDLIHKFRHATVTSTGTSLIWSGQSAQVVSQSFDIQTYGFSRDQAQWHLTLKTPSDRFFDVLFGLDKDNGCKIDTDCVTVKQFVPRTREEIKARVVQTGDAKLYRELFNEPMPPREIPA